MRKSFINIQLFAHQRHYSNKKDFINKSSIPLKWILLLQIDSLRIIKELHIVHELIHNEERAFFNTPTEFNCSSFPSFRGYKFNTKLRIFTKLISTFWEIAPRMEGGFGANA